MESYKFNRFTATNQETRWATEEEIRASGTFVDLSAKKYPVGGLPLLSDGKRAWVDGQDTHTLIFGATGSKKTRLFCMPMLNIFAKAGESFIATDPKGELYERTSGLARACGYQTIVLNFRDIGQGDMWNPLSLPYELYHSGNIETATSMLSDFIATIAEPHVRNTKDAFWPEMASAYALACLLLIVDAASPEEANVTSLAALCSNSTRDALQRLSESMPKNSICRINLESVLSNPDNTRNCIFSSLYSMLRVFATQKNLCGMLSRSSVDFTTIGTKKTALYIIVPDEKTTYHFLVTTFIKQIYEIMIGVAQKCPGGKLPVRVNFVLDEFCNIPKIPDMTSMISAARSRNMRCFLVAQSKHQLLGKYGEDAETIKGNCDNWVFLTSKELDLLTEISQLCGTTTTPNGTKRALISTSELQRLDKAKGEALIMHARQYPFITEIADIDMYEDFKGYKPQPLNSFRIPEANVFNINNYLSAVVHGRRRPPFYGQ